MIPHHELTDDEFLAMTGYELQFNAYRPYPDGKRKAKRVAKTDELITQASFKVDGEHIAYFRFTATDENGKTADTSAHYLDELK